MGTWHAGPSGNDAALPTSGRFAPVDPAGGDPAMTHAVKAQLFSGDLRPYPGIPGSFSGPMRTQAERDLRDCAALLGDDDMRERLNAADYGADEQDFWEDVARMAAAVRCAREAGLPIEQHLKGGAWGDAPWSTDELRRRLGPVFTYEAGLHNADVTTLHPLVREHGGRTSVLCGHWGEDEMSYWRSLGGTDEERPNLLTHALRELQAAGHRQAVIKTTEHKAGIWCVPLIDESTRQALPVEEVLADLGRGDEDFVWTVCRVGARADTFLVQPFLEMEHEYRFFIVDGRVVTGAANIEEFTPYSRDPAFRQRLPVPGRGGEDHDGVGEPIWLDSRTRAVRGYVGTRKSPSVEHRPDIVEKLARAAVRWSKEWPGTYVVDTAIAVSTGEPIVVEINGLPNAGLFACDPDALYRALLRAEDRGYRVEIPLRGSIASVSDPE